MSDAKTTTTAPDEPEPAAAPKRERAAPKARQVEDAELKALDVVFEALAPFAGRQLENMVKYVAGRVGVKIDDEIMGY